MKGRRLSKIPLRRNPLSVTTQDVVAELKRLKTSSQWIYQKRKLEGSINADVADHRLACIDKALKLVKSTLPQQSKIFH